MLASKNVFFLFHPSYRRKHYQDILLRKEGRSGSKPINQLTPLPCFPQNMISIFCVDLNEQVQKDLGMRVHAAGVIGRTQDVKGAVV